MMNKFFTFLFIHESFVDSVFLHLTKENRKALNCIFILNTFTFNWYLYEQNGLKQFFAFLNTIYISIFDWTEYLYHCVKNWHLDDGVHCINIDFLQKMIKVYKCITYRRAHVVFVFSTMSAFRASNYSITVSDSRPDGSVCKALLCNRKLQMNPISVRMKLSLRNWEPCRCVVIFYQIYISISVTITFNFEKNQV